MTSVRDRVLDAYETLLVESGPAATTLDAVAAAARVSKGGLLSTSRPRTRWPRACSRGWGPQRDRRRGDPRGRRRRHGLLPDHLRTRRRHPGGLTRTYLAALRVADHARNGTAVRDALAAVDADALAALHDRLGDPALAWLVQFIGDGLYLRTLIGTPLPEGLSVDDVLALLRPHLPPGEPGF